jgi:hypothetical protein
MERGQQEYIQLENTIGAHNYKPLDILLSRGEREYCVKNPSTISSL